MFLIFNGEFRKEDELLLRADNRGFRYGDGLFETMLVSGGLIRLGDYHVERMLAGMRLLRLETRETFRLGRLEAQIAQLCARNGHGKRCRARLTVFRAAAGAYNVPDDRTAYILQTSESGSADSETRQLAVDIYPDGRKACDALAGIKTNNYLLSCLAGIHAREHGWDDCLLLNTFGRIAETSVANLWWISRGRFHTPPLSEGCVAGVMRRYLLGALPAAGFEVREEPIGPEGLAGADEIFISNAIKGIQSVGKFRGRRYDHRLAGTIREEIIGKI